MTPFELAEKLGKSPLPRLLAFDVDGTLAPIVNDPAAAAVPEAVISSLRALSAQEGTEIAFLTGRDASSLARLVPITRCFRAVDHGVTVLAPLEMKVPTPTTAELATLAEFAHEIEQLGALVERKERSVGAHARGKPDPTAILEGARHAAERLGLAVRTGRMMVEASFLQGNKADALQSIQNRMSAQTLFFIGDDVTDLPAIEFAVEHGFGGFVTSPEGPRPPLNSVVFSGPNEVHNFLQQLSRLDPMPRLT